MKIPTFSGAIMQKNIIATFEKSANEEYDATFVVSATSADRVKDTIAPEAYTPNLSKRLPALFGHSHKDIIGTWENLRMDGNKLIGDLKLAGTNLGNMVKQLLVDNVPLMSSIGFSGSGEKNNIGGYHFKTIDLMEISVVAVGAHPMATRIAKSYGIELEAQSSEFLAIRERAIAQSQKALLSILK